MFNRLFLQIKKITPLKYQWILEHDGFRRYFANTGWMFAGQMVVLATSFFIGAWLARYLGPTNYGIINYALAFSGLFSFVASLGVDAILVRELVKTPEKRDVLMGTSFAMKLIGGLIALVLVTVAAFSFEASSLNRLLIIVFSFGFIVQAFNVISSFFQARVEAKYNSRVQIIANLISAALKIIFILSRLSLIYLMIIFMADIIWQSILWWQSYRQQGFKASQWRFSKYLASKIWSGSSLLMLSSAAAYIIYRVDQVMIGNILNEAAVGIYAVATKCVEVWYFIPVIISASLLPAIINANKSDKNNYCTRLKHLYVLMLILATMIALATTIFAQSLVFWIFGQEYLQSVAILQIYTWSSVGLFLALAMNQSLLTENKLKTIFFSNLGAMIINVILNLYLIKHIGLNGAAWATLITYSLLPLFMWTGKSNKQKKIK
ncbi:flippase [Patescibacteria group bacterium]|nr:flippase [Patescibacteria group bacterium]